jgi:hypothetical protein
MKVLFYLPVVTPWWFENIVEPILRRVAKVAETHVLAPAPWRNTGIGPEELARCVDLDAVKWAIFDGDEHPSYRTKPAEPDGLIAYVRELAPDIVLCRSADFDTVRHFPGAVRFLMEVASAPFDVAACTTTITDQPFANGALPTLAPAERSRLDALIDPLWTEMHAHWRQAIAEREDLFRELGIPDDRPVLLLPLEYEHEENFYLQHRIQPLSNAKLLTKIARKVTPRCTLVVTDHPLNALHVQNAELGKTVARLGRRVVLADTRIGGVPSTLALATRVDGILLGDSKSFSLAACFGVPMLRQSRFASASWLNTERDLERFVAAICAGKARAPSQADARAWFGYHLANEAFYPKDEGLTGESILDRALEPINPDRWSAGIARVRAVKQEYLA